MEQNPFKAPEARVADVIAAAGEFIPEGRRVPAGSGVDWFSRGWELFRLAPGPWIGITVVFALTIIVLSLIPLVNLFVNLLMPVFIGGIMLGCKALDDGEELRLGHLFAGFSGHAGNLVLVGVIYLIGIGLIVGVVVLLVGAGMFGAAALASGKFAVGAIVVPVLVGLLLAVTLAAAIWYAPALVVLQEMSPMQSLKASFFVCIKNIVPFLVYGLVFLVLAIFASIPIFLGWLVLMPVIYGSIYAGYRDMFSRA
jgi:uncharacterized membrane protein